MIINFGKPSVNNQSNSLPVFLEKHFHENPPKQLSLQGVERDMTPREDQESRPTRANTSKNGSQLSGKITEIITSDEEASSLTMLLPLLATLSKDDRWFAWVSPPKNLPKALLKEAGIALDKILLLNTDDQNSALKLAKKALSAGTCHAVISWAGDLSEHELANLEQSASIGASHAIVIRRRRH